MSEPVSYEVIDRVAVITIERPDKKNAMSMEVFDGLLAAGERAAKESVEDGGVGAVLVRGRGGTFSSGIDISIFGGQLSGPPDAAFIAHLQDCFTVFEDLEVPTVAAIEGYCFGGGIQLAVACHVRMVTPTAQLSVMETRWGLIPDLGGTWRIPRLVGLGRATEMAMTARKVTGAQALAMGLCDVELSTDDPQAEALAYATKLANGPAAVHRLPKIMRENMERDRMTAFATEQAVQIQGMGGPDFQEAIMASFEKRAPRFVGR